MSNETAFDGSTARRRSAINSVSFIPFIVYKTISCLNKEFCAGPFGLPFATN